MRWHGGARVDLAALGDDALAFSRDVDREVIFTMLWTTFVVRASPAVLQTSRLPPARPSSRAGVLGGVTVGASVLSCGCR